MSKIWGKILWSLWWWDTANKGWFATELALTTAFPIWEDWWFATIWATDSIWLWDNWTSAWIDTWEQAFWDMLKSENLSWLSNYDTARTNLWVPSLEMLSDTKAFTWFVDNLNITVTGNSINRTITLTHSTLVEYYFRWVYTSLTNSWTSLAHWSDTSKIYYLYSTDWINFNWSETVWTYDTIQIALAFYDTVNSKWVYQRQIHWTYDYEAHLVDHENIGTFRFSWWNPTAWTYVLNTNTDVSITPWFDQALIYDEDLPTIIPALIEWTYTTVYIWWSWIVAFWTTDSFPFKFTASWFINYNNTIAWTLVEWATGKSYNIYQILIPMASDIDSQKFRTIFLQPQNEYNTLIAAQAEDFRSLDLWSLANLSPEFVAYTRLTYTTNSSYATTGKVQLTWVAYLSWNRASQVLVWWFTPTDHSNLSNLWWTTSWHTWTPSNLASFDWSGLSNFTPISNFQSAETTTLTYGREIICRARTTANITLSWAQTIDWVSVIAWDYVLVANQSTASWNWVYIANASTWTRAPEFDATIEADKYDIFVTEWTANAKTWWLCATKNATIWSTSLVFTQIPNWIWTAADQAAAWNHTHTSIATTSASSIWAAISHRYTSRTATASTWTTDNIVIFSWSTALQIETIPDWVAVANNSWRVISFINNASVNWTLRQFTSNTLDWSASDVILRPWYFKVVQNIAVDTWITIGYWRINDAVDLEVATETYWAWWNGSNEVPTKDAIYDKFESLTWWWANLTWTDLLTAWEDLDAWEYYRKGVYLKWISQEVSVWGVQIWYSTSVYEQWQSITWAWWSLQAIWVFMIKQLNPNHIVNLEVYSDATFSTLVATSTNSVTTNTLAVQTECIFLFSWFNPSAWTYYFKANLVSWTISTTNYTFIYYNNTNVYDWWNKYVINSSWTPTSEPTLDLKFNVYSHYETLTSYYKAKAVYWLNKAIWSVPSNVTAWNTFHGNLWWEQDWYTWLIEWEIYYLQNDWTVWLTLWTDIIEVWQAIDDTKINTNIRYVLDEEYFDKVIDYMIFWSGTTYYWWTWASINVTSSWLWVWNVNIITSSSNWNIYSQFRWKPNINQTNLTWDQISVIEFEGYVTMVTTNSSIWFYWITSDAYTVASVNRKVMLTLTGANQFKLNTADWTTQSYWNAINVPATTNYCHKVKIVYTVWVDVKIYIDWILADTKTTNLPTWASFNIFFWLWWPTWSSEFWLDNAKIKIKFN